jgi:chromosome segregation ATPase
MPRPLNERQSLEQERAEIPGQIAAYGRELAVTPTTADFKSRRERLEWQIREREKRLADVRKRLAAINKAARSGGFPDV